MTKSLGRTYSLLDFSGREMHYWPGNLPRRRAAPCRVGVASPGTLYVRCYRALHPPVLVFQEDATCRPRRLLLFSPFAIPRPTVPFPPPPPPPPRQSSRCAYIASFWKGRPGRLRRTCVKSPRARCSCRRLFSLSESTSTRNFKSEICS